MVWKNWIPFVLALAFGLVAAKLGRDLLVRSRQAGGVSGSMAGVVVARVDISPGAVLSEQDLAVEKLPEGVLPKSAFKSTSELVGRVATVPVVRGLVIVEPMLAPAGSEGGVQALVPPGMRLVTVEVNEFSGVAGFVSPGNHVDVVSTLADDKTNQPLAKTVVENVKVVAVGQRVDASGTLGKKTEKTEVPPGRSVTLLVTPRQAEIIEFVSSSARLRLALRGQADNAIAASKSGIGMADLLERAAEAPDWFAAWLASPASLPAANGPATRPAREPVLAVEDPVGKPAPRVRIRTVEVINGSELTTVRYEQKDASAGSALTGTQDEHKQIGGNHD